ncbi:uncharacterized protein RAG0_03152 [Rhynchosporium agropyri]|uniref:Uncharacterized protein n=1 Tax=Rhynchosporium agropyri TaxID=914238 RepID=A0A1E1K3U0_9HELO|nr:uncharacterized protein RAG0_03152 [Rhynchosporium agropyri]
MRPICVPEINVCEIILESNLDLGSWQPLAPLTLRIVRIRHAIFNLSERYQRSREYRAPTRSIPISATTTQLALEYLADSQTPSSAVKRLRMPASDLVTSEHLAVHNLDDQSIREELERFGLWTEGLKFQPTTIPGVQRCDDPDRDKKVRPLLKDLGYENRVGNIGPSRRSLLIQTRSISNTKSYASHPRATLQAHMHVSFLFVYEMGSLRPFTIL